MPNAPIGTKPNSISPSVSFSDNIDPKPILKENTVNNKITTLSSPFKNSFAYKGICVKNIAPINQNQEIDKIERETEIFCSFISFIILNVSLKTL